MAFQLAPPPNLNVQPPNIDPLGQAAKMAQLKQMLGAQQLLPLQLQEQQQRVQSNDLAIKQQQQQVASQKAMIDAWSDPKFVDQITGGGGASSSGVGFDPNKAMGLLISKGVLPADAQAAVASHVKLSTDVAQMSKTQQEVFDKGHKQLATNLAPITDMKVSDAQAALDDLKQRYLKNPPPGIGAQDIQFLQQADLAHLPAIINHLGLASSIAEYHKGQSEAEKAENEARVAAQKIIPAGGGLSPDAQQQIGKDVAVATNPAIQAGKVQVATAEGQARANIEAAQARGSNAALANVPPHLVAPATAAVAKAGEEYDKANSVTQRMAATMDLARKGNVTAYQIIPQEGTLQLTTSQGVHRINKTEIDQYAGGGSLWQRLEGHLGKALTGQSIPDSVLKDMADIQKLQAEGARATYENSIKTINNAYGAGFKPDPMPPKQVGNTFDPSKLSNFHTNGQQRIGWNGKNWVDAATGQVVQ